MLFIIIKYLYFLDSTFLEARAEIQKYFRSFFGSNENFNICFRDLLTFRNIAKLYCHWLKHLQKDQKFRRALVRQKETKWSQPKAFPGTIPSWSPCIIAMNLSVVGSGPMWIPGKSRSKRYLINVVLPKTNDIENQSLICSSDQIPKPGTIFYFHKNEFVYF